MISCMNSIELSDCPEVWNAIFNFVGLEITPTELGGDDEDRPLDCPVPQELR
jgi:hypothetical protein